MSRFPLRQHPHLYEINTWAWLEKLSARLGRLVKLADVPDSEWDAIAGRGFDIVWFMGIWQHSAEARSIELADPENRPLFDRVLPGWQPEDVIGSPYSIAEYVPDPRIGSWDSLDSVREKLRSRGIAVFLDFVGNHTALDHPWTREHPEFYVQGSGSGFRARSRQLSQGRKRERPCGPRSRQRSLFSRVGRCGPTEPLLARDARRAHRRTSQDSRSLRRRALRHGDVAVQRSLRAGVGPIRAGP